MSKREYDSTVARIAGNLLSGNPEDWLNEKHRSWAVKHAVATARAIVQETKRTESLPSSDAVDPIARGSND